MSVGGKDDSPQSAAPLVMPAASFKKYELGGVPIVNENVRSGYSRAYGMGGDKSRGAT